MQLNMHTYFNGQCEEAFAFYARLLEGEVTFKMTYAGTPMENNVPPEWRNKIIHATLKLANATVQGADAPPGRYEKPHGYFLSLDIPDPLEAERIYRGLADGAKIEMPLAETFWAKKFGMLVDKFGIGWMVNCGKPMPANR